MRTEANLGLGFDLEGVFMTGYQVTDGALVLVGSKVLGVLRNETFSVVRLLPPLNGVTCNDAVGLEVRKIPLECYEVWFDINGFKTGE